MVDQLLFPDVPAYEGWGHPFRSEVFVQDLEVEGTIPPEIEGTWYRAGPDRQYPPISDDHIFIDGEGMVFMWRFAKGRVDYRCRWVRTARYQAQAAAGRQLFGRYRNRYTNDPSVAGMSMGTANTTAVWHAGKLLVLKEDDLPYEVDPDTLETIGRYDYDGAVTALTMSAHPKLDPVTSELLTFSYQAKGDATKDAVFYIVGADGKVARQTWFEMPYPGMVHDFAVTKDYAVFPFWPMMTDLEHVKAGGPYYEYHPDKPTVVGILPRNGTADQIRWFRGPNATAGHMMNAFQEGSKVHLDVCYYEGNCFDFFPTPTGETAPAVPPFLTRMTFDLAGNSDSYEVRRLLPSPCEMPRTDDRYQGRPYRYGYMLAFAGPVRGVGRIDHETGKLSVWTAGPTSGVQEAQFVPRAPDAPEGDGWLLSLVNRVEDNRSEVAILDAQNIEAGPVATVKMPVRVRSSFHGMWTPAAAFREGRYTATVAT